VFSDGIDGLNPALFDDDAGFAGGLLSLIYNQRKPSILTQDLNRARGQSQRAELLRNIFDEFVKDFPDSEHIATAYADMVRSMNQIGLPNEAVEIAERFFNNYGGHENYSLVADAALSAYKALEQQQSVITTYRTLIQWAKKGEKYDKYYRYIAELARIYTIENDLNDVVKLYWQEIESRPDDESLYTSFLGFLDSYRIFEEQEKVYKKAIERFDNKNYYDKLARWYIRQKKTAELHTYIREVAEVFKDSELGTFLNKFVRLSNRASDADKAFYETIYLYANQRFPRNLDFVNNLLRFYKRAKETTKYEALAFRYFYASEEIRRELLAHLSKNDRLDSLLAQISESKPSLLNVSSSTSPSSQDSGSLLLAASIFNWQSYFENGTPLLKALSERHPNNQLFLEENAKLLRSLERYEEAEYAYAMLAILFPKNSDYLVKAGELAMEHKGAEAAAQYWMQIPGIEPASSELRKETATLFWDYYQYDTAVAVLKKARDDLENDTLFGMEIGFLLEEEEQYQAAIDEYIRFAVLNADKTYQANKAIEQLAHLSTKMEKGALVDNGLLASNEKTDYSFASIKTSFLYYEKTASAAKIRTTLTTAIEHFDTEDELRWLSNKLAQNKLVSDQEKVLLKLAEITGNSPDVLLELARLHEQNGRITDAEKIYVNLFEDTATSEVELLPDYISALENAGEFYWRNTLVDKAFDVWKTLVNITDEYQQKSFILRFSNRFLLKDNFEKALWFAQKGQELNPIDEEYFNAVAAIYTKQDDYTSLSDLFSTTISAVRNSTVLNRDQRKYRIQNLRRGLIEQLTALGDVTAALDQYIEMINAEPNDEFLVSTAYRFARKHSLNERLQTYYEQTATKSFKDYRWQRILAWLSGLNGDNSKLQEYLETATKLEPQKTDLRQQLATSYMATGKFKQAADQYNKLYRFDRKNQYWQRLRAEALHLSGDTERANEILKEILAQSPDDVGGFFRTGSLMLEWGQEQEALDYINQGVSRVKEDLYAYRITESDLRTFIQAYLLNDDVIGAFDLLLELNRLYAGEANRSGNNRSWQARQGQRTTYDAFQGVLAKAVNSYADTATLKNMNEKLRSFVSGTSTPESTWIWVRDVAGALNFATLQEECLQSLVALNNSDYDSSEYQNHLHNLIDFYKARKDPHGLITVLEAQLNKGSESYFYSTVLEILADLYRYVGEDSRELKILARRWNRNSSGSSAQFDYFDHYVERYLYLLHKANDQTELKTLATSAGEHVAQVTNFLARNGYKDLATTALAQFEKNYNSSWLNSKRIFLGMQMDVDENKWQLSASPVDLMQDLPIGRRVTTSPSPDAFLSGDNWYQFLSIYCDYLLNKGEKETAAKLINGLKENAPSNVTSYHLVARWYLKNGNIDAAKTQLDIANKLSPENIQNLLLAGDIALANGEKQEAIRIWRIFAGGKFGLPGYNLYFDTMRKHNFFNEAKPQIESFIASFDDDDEYNWQKQEVFYLVSSWARDLGEDVYLVDNIIQQSRDLNSPIDSLSQHFFNGEFSTDALNKIVDEIISVAKALSLTKTDNEFVTPVLKSWLEEAILFADRTKQFDRMHSWLQLYEDRAYHEQPTYRIGNRIRFNFLKAKALFAVKETQAALDFVVEKITQDYGFNESTIKDLSALLKSWNMQDQALEIAIRFYDNSLNDDSANYSYQLALADLLLERSGSDDITRSLLLLQTVVQGSAENSLLLKQAAEVLEKHSNYQLAVLLRKQFMKRSSRDFENTLKLAIALGKSGKKAEALKLYRSIFSEKVSREVRLEAIPEYVKLVGAQAGEELKLYLPAAEKGESETIVILAHSLATAAGDSTTVNAISEKVLALLHEPADLLAWLGGEAEYQSDNLELLAKSLKIKTSKDIAEKILQLRLAQKAGPIAMLDEWRYSELQILDRYDFETWYGLTNDALYSTLSKVVDLMISAGFYSEALEYEDMRVRIAGELGKETTSRKATIQGYLDEIQQAKDKYRITASLSNK
jgi:tetratricopeptide (TPR) repeat protein/cytochrome c-type biogenesis protein CcmH/NrfG